jgi:hypothetical protein
VSRAQAGYLVVSAAVLLTGLSAGQLWAHHVAGWYLFLGGLLLIAVRSFL